MQKFIFNGTNINEFYQKIKKFFGITQTLTEETDFDDKMMKIIFFKIKWKLKIVVLYLVMKINKFFKIKSYQNQIIK